MRNVESVMKHGYSFHLTIQHIAQYVYWNRNSISRRLRANHNTNFAWGTVPHFFLEGGVELGDRVWYPMKAHHNGHNLSSETHTLPRFVF